MNVRVTTQSELDQALAVGAARMIPRRIPADETTAEKVARIVECHIVGGRCVTHQRPDDERPACPFVDALLREAGAL